MRQLATLVMVLGLAAAFAPVASRGAEVPPFYPKRAAKLDVPGDVVLSCKVNAEGTLRDCSVVSEKPEGYGFGEAAINMSAKFRMRPKTSEGKPLEGGTVRIPIAFRLPGDDKKPDEAPSANRAPQ